MAFIPKTEWEYEWSDAVAYMDDVGNFEFTGVLLPTPTTCRTTAVESFEWHHLAPMVGFRLSRDGSTVSITSIPELYYSKAYPYSDGWHPLITFSYKDSSGNYITIATFGGGGTAGENDYYGVTKSYTISGVTQAEIYVTCAASACGLHGKQNFLGYIKLQPGPPVVVSTSGTTITVRDSLNNTGKLKCTTTNSAWYTSPHTFTGLSQGTAYQFVCSDTNGASQSNPVSGRTWKISGSYSSTLKNLTFTATHTAGTNGDSNNSITYKLYTIKSTSGTPIGTKTSSSGGSVTFTDLNSNTTYYCYAYTTDIVDANNNPDNAIWLTAKTKTPATLSTNKSDVSATTLRVSLSWNVGDASSVSCTIACNGRYKTLSTNGGYVGFTGLTPGSNNSITWSIVTTYIIYDKNGKIKGTETYEANGSFILTTKKATLYYINEDTDITSKIIRFSSSCNTSDPMEHKISPGDNWHIPDKMPEVYNNLTHNTQYTVYCQISGCYAFNEAGDVTTVNDSVISKIVTTKTLSLSVSISEEHQHSIVTLWQAYVNGIATNKDAIDGTLFEFTYMDTIARKNNPPYQSAEVIEGSNGNTTGYYQSDRKIYSNNLTWYYCEYIVTASLTDGYNIVANAITVHTIFPAVWIFSGSQWHRYMGHVYTNGKYVPAPIFVYNNNRYIEPKGE